MTPKKEKMFFSIACDAARLICDKSQVKEASLVQKVKHVFHLLFCKFCRIYSQKNTQLTQLLKKENVKAISTEREKTMKEAFEKELIKNQS